MMKAVIAIVPNVWMMTVTIAATRIVMIRIAAAVTVTATVATKNVHARAQNVYEVRAKPAQIPRATMTTACFVRSMKEQSTWT